MDEHPDVGLTGPKVFNPDGTLQQSHWPVPTLRGRLMRALRIGSRGILDGHSASADRDKTVGVLSGCFWMVRRSALGDVGLLDEGFFMYAEDTDWCKRFWDAGWKVVYMPSATAMHYGGGSSANTPVKSYIEMHRANLRYWGKHHGLLGKMGVYLTMLLHQGVRILGGGMLLLTSRSKRESIRPVVRRSLACLYYLCAGVRPQTG
jgi:GT2 family glycosyltransferase